MRQLPKKEPHEHMNTERVMERVRRLLAIANDPAASDNEQRIALEQPGNENSRPKFEQLIDPRQPLSEFITGLTGITDQILQGMPSAGAAMLRFHQWLDRTWPAGEPLTIIAHNAEFDVSFLDAAERVYDPTASGFDCRWLCTKEMSWELNPQKQHHRLTDLIADYHIGDTEEHRALADAIQEQMIYRALCHEATMRGKWIGQ